MPMSEQKPLPRGLEMGTARLEAFTDGVMAVIITIMAFELRPPDGGSLDAVGAQLPGLLVYVLSFAFVAIYWNNHHHLLRAAKSDQRRGDVGESRFLVLAVPHSGVDGVAPRGVPFRAARCDVWVRGPYGGVRLFHPYANAHSSERSGLGRGTRRQVRHQGIRVARDVRRRCRACFREPLACVRALRRRIADVVRPRSTVPAGGVTQLPPGRSNLIIRSAEGCP